MTDDLESLDPQPATAEWYYMEREHVVAGPISEEALLQAARSGQITQDTLIWHQDFDNWQAATSVPVTAAILGRDPNAIEPTAIRRRVEPPRPAVKAPKPTPVVTETQPPAEAADDDSPVVETLQDAVTDEEGAIPTIDFKLAREIVDRVSGIPPRPTERSIPPSSFSWYPPPDRAQLLSLLGRHRQIGIVVASLLIAAVVLMLAPRARSRKIQPPVVTETTVVDQRVMSTVAQPASSVETRAALPQPPERPAVSPATSDTPAPSAGKVPSASAPLSEPAVTVVGPLDPSLFLRHLNHGLRIFDEQCWDAVRAPGAKVAKNPSVRIELFVDHTGRVYDVKSSKPPPGYRGAGRCIAGRMRGWKFPWAPSATRAVVIVNREHD
jgi:hypothetical protein